jgi:4-hydroxybenzoate polyprenyltransferase
VHAQPSISTSSASSPVVQSAPGALVAISKDIKLAHSVFALPFALLASVMVMHAAQKSAGARSAGQIALLLVLIVVCMVAARTFAMVVNRVADREIDAGHVRTKGRAFAAGRVSARTGLVTIAACAVVFICCAALFGVFESNWLPCILAVPVLGLLALYSFTKRFTALCHLVLGVCLAASPLCAAVALAPEALRVGGAQHQPAQRLIRGIVLCWVAGFDIIYALQDQSYDSAKGLHSIPAALGTQRSVWVSRLLHASALGLLASAVVIEPRFGVLMLAAFAVVVGLLIWEHTILTKLARQSAIDPASPPPALNMAFFTLNGVVSCVLGACGIADVLLV